MSIRFFCPLGHRLKVPDHRAGKKGRCPRCHQRVIVPVGDPRPSGESKRPWNAGDAAAEQHHPGHPGAPGLSPQPPGILPQPSDLFEVAEISPAAEQHQLGPATGLPQRPDLGQPHDLLPRSGSPKKTGSHKTSGKKLGTKSGRVKKPDEPSAGGHVAAPPPLAKLAGTPGADAPSGMRGAKRSRPSHHAGSRQGPGGMVPSAAGAGAAAGQSAMSVPGAASPRWIGRARPELLAHASRPGLRRLETAYWLAAASACLAVFGAAPALEHLNFATAPGWARLLLLSSAVELVYVAWLASLPDWSTIRVGVVVWGLAGMLHALRMVSMALAPDSHFLNLGFPASGSSALAFSAANLVLAALASYFCGRVSAEWRLSERSATAA